MDQIVFNDEFSPLLLSTTIGPPNPETMQVHWSACEQLLQEERPFVTIHDLAKASVPSAEFRETELNWIERNREPMSKYLVGTALIVANPILRLAFDLVLLRRDMPMPYKFVANIEDATAWVFDKMRENDMLLPDQEKCVAALHAAREKA